LRDLDQRHPAQHFPRITALVALIAMALDQALGFIEVQGGHGHAAAGGNLADGEFFVQVLRGDHWKNSLTSS